MSEVSFESARSVLLSKTDVFEARRAKTCVLIKKRKIKSNAKNVAFLVLKSELSVCVVRVVRFWEFPAIFRGK